MEPRAAVPNHVISDVVRHLRRAAFRRGAADLTDGGLLRRFVEHRDGDAFAALVHRHGPMVWGVCRRALAGHHDAEDAFQATFIVLARKAAYVRPPDMVGNWLYGVARQTARKAQASAAKRAIRFLPVAQVPEPAAEFNRRDDLRSVLDEELSRLPDKYRSAIVLCDLEGKTRDEAARELGCPPGTVASRLATARTMLAKRLGRHVIGLTGGGLAAVLAQEAAAAVPFPVLDGTTEAASLAAMGLGTTGGSISINAAALADEVLKTMLLINRKAITVLLLAVAALGVGTVGLTQGLLTGPTTKVTDEQPAAQHTPSPWTKRLASGVTVELVGTSPSPLTPKSWQRPDGSQLAEAPYDTQPGQVHPGPGQQAREFAVRLQGLPAGSPGITWEVRPSNGSASGTVRKNGRPLADVAAAAFVMPADQPTCTVRVGVAAGPWTTEASGTGGSSQSREKVSVAFGVARPVKDGVAITVSTNLVGPEIRLVAVDADGAEHSPGQLQSSGAGGVLYQMNAVFNLPPERVREYWLQSRPYEWAEFPTVRLAQAGRQ